MVTDELIHHVGRQIIRERYGDYSFVTGHVLETTNALLMATGYDLASVLSSVVPEKADIRAEPRELTYAKCVAYGLNPVKLRLQGCFPSNPYKWEASTSGDHGLSDPLQLATFFAVYGMKDEADLLLQERRRYIEAHTAWLAAKSPEFFTSGIFGNKRVDFGKYTADRKFYRTWIPPDFEELGLPRESFMSPLDSLFMGDHAFEEESYTQAMTSAITPQYVESLAMISGVKNKRMHPELQRISYNQAYTLCTNDKGGGFRYEDMAVYLRLVSPEEAATILKNTKGARQMMGLVRPDSPTEFYLAGLRHLSQAADSTREEIITLMGRGPTVEEVKSIKTIGIINILYEMDWELLAPIAQQPGLRAAALPFAEKLGPMVLRSFLTDHPQRKKRIFDIGSEASRASHSYRVSDKTSVADWEHVMGRLHTLYTRGVRTRQALHTASGDPIVSFLALLDAHGSSSADIRPILREHSRWKEIKRALEGYEVPDVKSVWS